MGDSRSKKNDLEETIYVKEMWWEGKDLHIIDQNDKEIIFRNAYFVDYKSNDPESE